MTWFYIVRICILLQILKSSVKPSPIFHDKWLKFWNVLCSNFIMPSPTRNITLTYSDRILIRANVKSLIFKCVLQTYVYWRLERDSLIFGDSSYHKNILRTLWSYIEHDIFKNIKQFEINIANNTSMSTYSRHQSVKFMN